MPTESLTLFMFTESPLHAGTGATLSVIDLPVQRETHTQHPIVYGTGLKGALREVARKDPLCDPIFGPENGNEHAGLGIFSEARVLLFPVASFQGVFVWVACPRELHRLQRDLLALDGTLGNGQKAAQEFRQLQIPNPGQSKVAASAKCTANLDGKIFLGEVQPLDVDSIHTKAVEDLAAWLVKNAFPAGSEYDYWRTKAAQDIVIVNDDEFQHLARFSTHIEVHIKIDQDKGTVAEGPWTEESLPPDTLLYSTIVVTEPRHDKIRNKLNGQVPAQFVRNLLTSRFQLAGHQNVAKGWVCPRILG